MDLFADNSHTFSGTSSEAGNYSIKVTAADNEGGTGSDIFRIVVQTPGSLEQGINGDEFIWPNQAVSYVHIGTWDRTPPTCQYTYSICSGTLCK